MKIVMGIEASPGIAILIPALLLLQGASSMIHEDFLKAVEDVRIRQMRGGTTNGRHGTTRAANPTHFLT
jgi:hypothetical protein